MAEVKNTFIQSKMNRDLDGRIIPNGQYRYGNNIQISRSEGDDVGALENSLGTELLTSFGLTNPNYEIIGHTVDVSNDLIYVFITDYSDSSNNQLDNNITGQNNAFGLTNKNCFIAVYNNKTNIGTLLVGGDFLNFSKTHPITGVNLIEDLLFWTDNRNQPRKINVETVVKPGNSFILGGAVGYYTNEDTISVAKYYPFECISLLKPVPGRVQYDSSMTNKTEVWLPPYCAAAVDADQISGQVLYLDGDYTNIPGGNEVKISGIGVPSNPATGGVTLVTSVIPNSPSPGKTQIILNTGISPHLEAGDIVYFHFANPEYDAIWPGDETYLSDKFVRFSYRFEFDDGEYSLMAPFTQACFVPKQDGYFIGNDVKDITPPDNSVPADAPAPAINWPISSTLIGDEGKAYASSIVEFFENKIQDIGLYIPAPYKNNTQSTFDNIQDEFKIKSIEIIYKESDSTNAYVLDTIDADSGVKPFNLETSSFYLYDYQSRKPWKTLPGNEITRVYDKVPLRALAQESSGNRIIYGNYVDKHTSPDGLSYVVGIDPKPNVPEMVGDFGFGDKQYYVQKEYQNHTVKQNRTYQVGIVLSDRYGRQSDVILSNVFDSAIAGMGSTIYHPYRSAQSTLISDLNSTLNPTTWPGDQINIIWHQIIPELATANGYPGTYVNNDGTLAGLSGTWTGLPVDPIHAPCCFTFTAFQGPSISATFRICADAAGVADLSTFEIISSDPGWTEGGIFIQAPTAVPFPCGTSFSIGNPDIQAIVLKDQNTLGWYSWKVVVKQSEQDYYNCYLPGMLAGYPKDIRGNTPTSSTNTSATVFPKGDVSNTAHIVLINDNINKIPRDLSKVGPQQKAFGSSVKLYGRVENFKYHVSGEYFTYNRQYDPETLPDTVVNIGNITDLNLGKKEQAGSANVAVAPLSYPHATSIMMPVNFYNGVTNPLVAQVSTNTKIGWSANDNGTVGSKDLGMIPYLSVYETAPVVSELDIYWETSTSGLISELNYNIENIDNTAPCGMTNLSIDWTESQQPGSIISDIFKAVSCTGVELDSLGDNTTIQLLSVINRNGVDRSTEFILDQPSPLFNSYQLKINNATQWMGYFLAWNDINERTWDFTFQINRAAITSGPVTQQAYSAQFVESAVVQNAPPNQTGMFDTGGGNSARSDIKAGVFNMERQYLNYHDGGAWTATSPVYQVVGEWQAVNPYNGDADNIYWSTFGRNYEDSWDWTCDYMRYSNGDGGYGPYDVGQQDFFPVYETIGASSGANVPGSYIPPPGTPSVSYSKYLDAKISMIKRPGYVGSAPWDGVFKAFNGAYGTQPGFPWPTNPNKGQELFYEVIRAYQVSAFFPLQLDLVEVDCFNPSGDQSGAGYGKWGIGEIVFSNDGSAAANPEPLYSALPDMGAWKIQSREWVTGWYDTTYGSPPPGPVYYDYQRLSAGGNPTTGWPTTGTAATDPKDVSTGGEAFVCQNYNIGNSHYWKDLADAIDIDGAPISKIWTVDEFQPLTPAYSSGSSWSNYSSVPKKGFWYVRNTKIISQPDPLEHHLEMQFQLAQACWPDKYEAAGVSSPDTWKIPHFYVENDSPPNPYDPQTATLKTSSYTPVPPGRYVVTVRVTDRSITAGGVAAGDGLYFEWDVPVIINGPFSQTIESGYFTIPTTDPTWTYTTQYPSQTTTTLFNNGLGESPWAGSGGL